LPPGALWDATDGNQPDTAAWRSRPSPKPNTVAFTNDKPFIPIIAMKMIFLGAKFVG
jgi:hypothetical protein